MKLRKTKYCPVHKTIPLQKIRRLPEGETKGRGRVAWYCRLCGE